MKRTALPVAVCIIHSRGDILLIQRARGDYVGAWALPGGKIEVNEHVERSAIREVVEETGLDVRFMHYAGLVSEHLIKDGEVKEHFLLHICMLKADSRETKNTGEGDSKWFSPEEIISMGNSIIPSDLEIIRHFTGENKVSYFSCEIEDTDSGLKLLKFTDMTP